MIDLTISSSKVFIRLCPAVPRTLSVTCWKHTLYKICLWSLFVLKVWYHVICWVLFWRKSSLAQLVVAGQFLMWYYYWSSRETLIFSTSHELWMKKFQQNKLMKNKNLLWAPDMWTKSLQKSCLFWIDVKRVEKW